MKYELMAILDPRKTEKENEKMIDELKKILTENGLSLIEEDIWGNREMAYKMKGFTVGYYVVMTFEGEQAGLPEIHKELKLMNDLVRYLLQKMPDSYSLMRYDGKKASKVEASDHAKELQEKIMKREKKVEPKKEEPKAEVEEVVEVKAKEDDLTEVEKDESVTGARHADNNEETAQEDEANEEKEEKTNDKLDEKLKAIIDDTDINF